MNISIAPLQNLEQASGVARLFLQVYGKGYPVDLYYDPQRLLQANLEGDTLSQIASDETGRVVGHCALYRSAPNARLLELGAGLVHPDTRGKGTIAELLRELIVRARDGRLADWLFAEAVCNHTTTQRVVDAAGFIDTALEVDLMPAAAYSKEASAVGRVSTLLSFFPLADGGAKVYLPEPYADELRTLYAALGAPRTLGEASMAAPSTGPGQVGHWRNEAADLLRMTVTSLGSEYETWLAESATIVQISLPLDSPHTGWAAEQARAAGFVLAGLLPRWGDTDHLLLQRFHGPTEWDHIALFSDHAKAMLTRVRSECVRS